MQKTEYNGCDNSTLPVWVRHDGSMDQQALERLGHQIVSRRVASGYRNRTNLANSLQFTVRTVSDIENGVPSTPMRAAVPAWWASSSTRACRLKCVAASGPIW
jgi:hypothetical protein